MSKQIGLFQESEPEPEKPERRLSPPIRCPQCGGAAIATVHPEWHNGNTYYCANKCNDFYFTPP